LSAAGAKAIAAQDRSPLLWFEGNAIGLAALIANDFKAFAIVAAASALFSSAKICAARITTWFTSFRVT
jgi:hypothetical protein